MCSEIRVMFQLPLRFVILAFLILLSLETAFPQLPVVYVDVTNGSDTYSGANPTNTPPGSGPKASLHAGLTLVDRAGRLVIYAGTYPGDGIDTDGSTSNAIDNADLEFIYTKYPRLVDGLTVELRSLDGSNEVRILIEANSVKNSNGALITHTSDEYSANLLISIPNGSLTVTSATGNEYLSLSHAHSSGFPVSKVSLMSGQVYLASSSHMRLLNGSTIMLNGLAGFTGEAPLKGASVSLLYQGAGNVTAGPESRYGSYGEGTLTVSRNPGSTITFPNSMGFSGSAIPEGRAPGAPPKRGITISSGHAIFNGVIELGHIGDASTQPSVADVLVQGTGSAAFNRELSLVVGSAPSPSDSSISSIENHGTGSVGFAEQVTWRSASNVSGTPIAQKTYPAGAGTSLVRNTSSGSIVFSAIVELSASTIASPTGDALFGVAVENAGTGALSFSQGISAVNSVGTTSGNRNFTVNTINSNTGTLTISGILRGSMANVGAASGSIIINGPTELYQRITNAVGKTIVLGSHTLAVSRLTEAPFFNNGIGGTTSPSVVAHFTNGGSISVSTGRILLSHRSGTLTFDGGNLGSVAISGAGGETELHSNPFDLQNLVLSEGELTAQAPISVAGPLTIQGGTMRVMDEVIVSASRFTQIGGTFVLGSGVSGQLRVSGDFGRTAGSFVTNSGSTLSLAGTGNQRLMSGPSFQLRKFILDNAGGTIAIDNTLAISQSLLVSEGTVISLDANQLIVNGDNAALTNGGRILVEGEGAVVIGGASLPGGRAVSGVQATASGSGAFSSLIVDIGSSNSMTVTGSVKFNRMLKLVSGTVQIAAGDFGPAGSTARIVRDITSSGGILPVGGLFNAANVSYDLEYTGSLTSNVTTGQELIAPLANVRHWSINIDSDGRDGDGNLLTGTPHFFQLPANGFVYNGALSLGPLAAVRIAPDGTANDAFELSGTGVVHNIRGMLATVDAGDYLLFSGAVVTVVGSLDSAEPGSLGDVVVSSTTSCSFSSVHAINGSFSTRPNSIVSLGMGSSTSSPTLLAAQQRIAGTLTIAGNALTLTSSVEVRGGISFNSGRLNLGPYDLQLTTSGSYSQGSSALGYSASGGSLVMNRSGASLAIGNTPATALPNLKVLANTLLTASGRVSGRMQIGATASVGIPLFTFDTNNLTFTGTEIVLMDDGSGGSNTRVIVSNDVSGIRGGALIIAGPSTVISVGGNYSIEEMTLNTPGGTGTLTIASTTSAARELSITDMFTHIGGELVIGANHVVLLGTGSGSNLRSYNRSAGTVTATTGEFRFSGVAPQQFEPGVGFSIPNLTVKNDISVSNASPGQAFTVTRRLDLVNGTLVTDPGTLIMSGGVTVIRRRTAARITATPLFGPSVNVSYLIDQANGNIVTGRELPTVGTVLRDLTIDNPNSSSSSDNVTLDKSITVNGTLSLLSGELDEGALDMTMALGSTMIIGRGRFESTGGASDAPTVSEYHLVYKPGTSITSTSSEFQAGAGTFVRSLTVANDDNGNTSHVVLHQPRTVGDLTLTSAGGGLSLGAPGSFVSRVLTVLGHMAVSAGSITNTTGSAAMVDLAGVQHQVITTPPDGLTFQGGASTINLRLNNRSGFTLRGGGIVFLSGANIVFVNGIVEAESAIVVLSQTQTSQGFDRSSITGSNVSHIRGRVRHFVSGGAGNPSVWPNGRFEFPIGTATRFRPVTINFTNAYPAVNPTNVEVQFVEESPGGIIGLPLDGGSGVRIGGYPPYYWKVKTTPTAFSASQQFDFEVQGTGYGFVSSRPEDLRIIWRVDGNASTNAWQLEGTGLSYPANSIQIPSPGDTIISVRALAATSGLSTQGGRFAIGFPTRPPVFLSSLRDTSIQENQKLTFDYVADPLDAGELITFSLVNPPAGASINPSTGRFTWVPSFSQAGPYSIIVSATDGQFTVITSGSILVLNVNRGPTFTRVLRDTTIYDTQDTLRFKYDAIDPDGDPVTFRLQDPPQGMEISADGLIVWSPLFGQAGQSYRVKVLVSDGSRSDSTSATVSVLRARLRGDVSGDGAVTAFDASLVLQHVTGVTILTDISALIAADASANGTITAYDAALILQYVLGIITRLPP